MILDHISSRLNTTVSPEQAALLGRYSQLLGPSSPRDRHREMQERWGLLQDNEYLLAALYADRDVFPRVLGSCGQYFALEYLEPALEGHVGRTLAREMLNALQTSTTTTETSQCTGCNMKTVPTMRNIVANFPLMHSNLPTLAGTWVAVNIVVSEEGSWPARIKLAVLILDLLQEIDNSLSEGFSFCDVKPSHFGLSPSSGKIKFLDLDVALPRAIVNTVTADGSSCRVNSDCSLFDCRSRCNTDTHRCDSPQTNDNLQIVCEKIFLGWTVSGSVIMPGLLMAPQTPSTLASLLRQCADSDSRFPQCLHKHLSGKRNNSLPLIFVKIYQYEVYFCARLDDSSVSARCCVLVLGRNLRERLIVFSFYGVIIRVRLNM
ncbi:Family with sequence similarity 69 member C [Homalodisca vitripennis]|nr:Family with sequence similarity 69 member C [Homalodisca vitripennis]